MSDRRQRHPTYVGLVFEYLKKADDFRKVEQIMAETKLDRSVVNKCLVMLRSYKAVEAVEVENDLWWCAAPWSDQRMKTYRDWPEHTRKVTKRKRIIESGTSTVIDKKD